MKKKILSAIVSGFALVMLMPASSFALAAVTDVTGTVTDNGSPVVNAHVIVICKNVVKRDYTDGSGTYLVQYKSTVCPLGSPISVTAVKGNAGGNNYGKANKVTNKLNVAIVNVSLPEFGLITGIGAAIVGGAAFMFVRRRHLSASQE